MRFWRRKRDEDSESPEEEGGVAAVAVDEPVIDATVALVDARLEANRKKAAA